MKTTKIYLVTNCYGDPNKIYIGKTSVCRKIPHQRTFGKQITYDYIDEVNSLSSKDWKPLECFWIEQFRSFGFDIQNINKGGNGRDYTSEETKLKMSKASMGQFNKPIFQYDLEGNFIQEWIGMSEVEKKIGFKRGNISSCCRGRTKTAFNFIWRYKNNPLPSNYVLTRFDRNKKEITQYDLEGDFIKNWDSITQASKQLNINTTDISGCCLKTQKTCHGYIFRFKNDPLPENYKLPKTKGVPIIQYNKNGDFVRRWDRIIDVESELGFTFTNIIHCLKNKQKTAFGYKWKYEIFE